MTYFNPTYRISAKQCDREKDGTDNKNCQRLYKPVGK